MAQVPIVLQLQQLATENATDITELLRKALLVATKLDLKPFREWAWNELTGYSNIDDIPAYRCIDTTLSLKGRNQSLTPYLISDQELMKTLCAVKIKEPVEAIMDLLRQSDNRSDATLHQALDANVKILLMEMQMQVHGTQMEPVRVIGRSKLVGIIDTVRTQILNWSLQLETQGILGHNMTFSQSEKEKAHQTITIHNFQGILGDVTGSTVTQNLQMTVQKGDFESLRSYLEGNKVSPEDIESLKQALAKDPKPTTKDSFGEATSGWIGKMITKASTKLWDIGIEKAAGLLIQGIAMYYGLQ